LNDEDATDDHSPDLSFDGAEDMLRAWSRGLRPNGTATLYQLTKRYTSGAQSWTRAITKPVAGTVTIALNGTSQASGWSVSTTTGLITFTTAPAAGVAITAGFEFDVPVRFDTDALDVTLDLERLGSITSILLVEIRT